MIIGQVTHQYELRACEFDNLVLHFQWDRHNNQERYYRLVCQIIDIEADLAKDRLRRP